MSVDYFISTYTFVYSDNVYKPFVEDFLTTKHPSLSSCFSNDSDRCLDMSSTNHLKQIFVYSRLL